MKFRDIGIGTWEFVTHEGEKYELIGGDESRYRDGKNAVLEGKIREDLMSAGNMGPIFEVESAEIDKE